MLSKKWSALFFVTTVLCSFPVDSTENKTDRQYVYCFCNTARSIDSAPKKILVREQAPCGDFNCFQLLQAASCDDIEMAVRVLENLSIEQKYTLLTTTDPYGNTPFNWAADNHNTAMIKLFLEGLLQEQKYTVIAKSSWWGVTALHRAAQYNDIELAALLLENLSQEQKYTLLMKTDDEYGSTVLSSAVAVFGRNNIALAQLLLAGLTTEQKYTLLATADSCGMTVLHWVAATDTRGYVQELMADLLFEQKYTLLEKYSCEGCTPLHFAAEKEGSLIVQEFLEPLVADIKKQKDLGQKFLDLLALKNRNSQSVLELVQENHSELMAYLETVMQEITV